MERFLNPGPQSLWKQAQTLPSSEEAAGKTGKQPGSWRKTSTAPRRARISNPPLQRATIGPGSRQSHHGEPGHRTDEQNPLTGRDTRRGAPGLAFSPQQRPEQTGPGSRMLPGEAFKKTSLNLFLYTTPPGGLRRVDGSTDG
ncbi:hypothetical protein AAFF_G00243950 [Aldrovandia affinis]|uniref:Uncharacterized protein n=1 Tax=Aldrovandia affinis TaxID=143900 RepID=A0AAD7RDR3_9TELE|nr:hypothetical protein AAFF_G00243950 [Aldrovandia affinis]